MILYDKFLILPGSQYFIPCRITIGTYSTQPRRFYCTCQQFVCFECFSAVLYGDQIRTGTGTKEPWQRDTEGVGQWGAEEDIWA